jgi:hypothetical protein
MGFGNQDVRLRNPIACTRLRARRSGVSATGVGVAGIRRHASVREGRANRSSPDNAGIAALLWVGVAMATPRNRRALRAATTGRQTSGGDVACGSGAGAANDCVGGPVPGEGTGPRSSRQRPRHSFFVRPHRGGRPSIRISTHRYPSIPIDTHRYDKRGGTSQIVPAPFALNGHARPAHRNDPGGKAGFGAGSQARAHVFSIRHSTAAA